MNPIITAALNGPIATREHNPALPESPADIAESAKGAYEAGAAVIHIHLRDEQGDFTTDLDVAKRTVELVREACPGIVQLSTGGMVRLRGPHAHRRGQAGDGDAEPVHHDVRRRRVPQPAQADDGSSRRG